MTREEEIKKQAEKKALEPSRLMHPFAKQYKVMSAYEIGFIEGAVWADAHPHWISVFDETPKVDMLIFVVQLGKVTTFRYQYERAEVLKNVFGITHWMPLPQAPTVAKNATVKKGGER